jgi:hypothetical protein
VGCIDDLRRGILLGEHAHEVSLRIVMQVGLDFVDEQDRRDCLLLLRGESNQSDELA